MTHGTPHLADPSQPAVEPATGTWRHVLDALRAAGESAGANAADWWAQDIVGGRASGDTAATARAILAGLDDGDPLICDALPGYDLSGRQDPDTATEAQIYADAAPPDAPRWDTLTDRARAESADAFADSYHTAARDRIAEHCHLALPDHATPAAARRPTTGRSRVPTDGGRRQ